MVGEDTILPLELVGVCMRTSTFCSYDWIDGSNAMTYDGIIAGWMCRWQDAVDVEYVSQVGNCWIIIKYNPPKIKNAQTAYVCSLGRTDVV